MAYRETEKVKIRKAATRKQVLNCALAMVAENGFSALQMSQLAIKARLATGTLYRYFPSKESISTEVFRYATEIEVNKVAEVLQTTQGNAAQRIYSALSVFAERALRAPRMAWALIAEPVDPAVDEARLAYRGGYCRSAHWPTCTSQP
jgi:AcrR family transcriptional regulator